MKLQTQYLGVVDENLLESVGEHVTDVLGISVTDVGHQSLSLEATTDTVVDTLRLAPVGLDTVVSEKEDMMTLKYKPKHYSFKVYEGSGK